jgi:hypothetical protein
VLAVFARTDEPAVVTVTPQSPLASKWNRNTVGSYLTNCAGATAAGTGSSQTVQYTWATVPSSPNNVWHGLTAAIEVADFECSSRLYIDAASGTPPTPAWVNAQSYPSIQAAMDAIEPPGGTVYLPAGTYLITDTIVIRPNGGPVR